MKILIADDDAVSRKVLELMLRKAGYDVVTACDGLDALQKLLDENGPRLALVDWMMPGLDGPEVCRRLRAAHDRCYIYVTLLTSKDTSEDLVEGLEAGADDYLTKPCNSAELRARLRTGERILQLEDKLVAAREEMRFKATHDALTSLWNRGKIMEVLESSLHGEGPVAALMCDIDHFKAINDTYGHLTGDAVLRELANRLRAAVRGNDFVGRYGGEEFLVILAGCGPENLFERAEALRRAVSGSAFTREGGQVSFTLSVGAVATEQHGASVSSEAILSLADAALYRAKREGRDRVVIAERFRSDQVA